eukprot:3786864-Pyramimonas_sp.AAC.1
MEPKDRPASATQCRCGSIRSPILSMPTSPMHRQRRRCIADTSERHPRCGMTIRPHLLGPH